MTLNSFLTAPVLSPNYFESHLEYDVIPNMILSIKFPHGRLKDKTFRNSTCHIMIKTQHINSHPLVSNIQSVFPFFQLSDNYFFYTLLESRSKNTTYNWLFLIICRFYLHFSLFFPIFMFLMKKQSYLYHRVFPILGFADYNPITWPSVLCISSELLSRSGSLNRLRFSHLLVCKLLHRWWRASCHKDTNSLSPTLSCRLPWGSSPRSVIFIPSLLLNFDHSYFSKEKFFSLFICLTLKCESKEKGKKITWNFLFIF